jgi:hypothetical protein
MFLCDSAQRATEQLKLRPYKFQAMQKKKKDTAARIQYRHWFHRFVREGFMSVLRLRFKWHNLYKKIITARRRVNIGAQNIIPLKAKSCSKNIENFIRHYDKCGSTMLRVVQLSSEILLNICLQTRATNGQ